MRSPSRRVVTFGFALLFTLSLGASAQSRRQGDKDKSDDAAPISIMDSTQAQWGMRSVNDSVYQGYTVNGVYLERDRTNKLPESFPKYTPRKLGNEIVVRSSDQAAPSTIRVNGVDKPLEKAD